MHERSPKIQSLQSDVANLKESRTGIDIESIEADLQKANVEKSAIDAEYSAILKSMFF